MKRILKFLQTTLVGGILFLVPIMVLAVVVGKALTFVHKVVDPLAAHLPVESVIGLKTPMLLAIAVIVLFCFLAGFFARTVFAKKLISRLETSVLSNVPGYEFLKGMSESTLGVEKEGAYPVVFARFDDAMQIGFQVDTLDNDLVVVFIPDAPNPQTGAVCLMTLDRVTPVNLPPAATLKCLKRFGAESNALVKGLSLEPTPAK